MAPIFPVHPFSCIRIPTDLRESDYQNLFVQKVHLWFLPQLCLKDARDVLYLASLLFPFHTALGTQTLQLKQSFQVCEPFCCCCLGSKAGLFAELLTGWQTCLQARRWLSSGSWNSTPALPVLLLEQQESPLSPHLSLTMLSQVIQESKAGTEALRVWGQTARLLFSIPGTNHVAWWKNINLKAESQIVCQCNGWCWESDPTWLRFDYLCLKEFNVNLTTWWGIHEIRNTASTVIA